MCTRENVLQSVSLCGPVLPQAEPLRLQTGGAGRCLQTELRTQKVSLCFCVEVNAEPIFKLSIIKSIFSYLELKCWSSKLHVNNPEVHLKHLRQTHLEQVHRQVVHQDPCNHLTLNMNKHQLNASGFF